MIDFSSQISDASDLLVNYRYKPPEELRIKDFDGILSGIGANVTTHKEELLREVLTKYHRIFTKTGEQLIETMFLESVSTLEPTVTVVNHDTWYTPLSSVPSEEFHQFEEVICIALLTILSVRDIKSNSKSSKSIVDEPLSTTTRFVVIIAILRNVAFSCASGPAFFFLEEIREGNQSSVHNLSIPD